MDAWTYGWILCDILGDARRLTSLVVDDIAEDARRHRLFRKMAGAADKLKPAVFGILLGIEHV